MAGGVGGGSNAPLLPESTTLPLLPRSTLAQSDFESKLLHIWDSYLPRSIVIERVILNLLFFNLASRDKHCRWHLESLS